MKKNLRSPVFVVLYPENQGLQTTRCRSICRNAAVTHESLPGPDTPVFMPLSLFNEMAAAGTEFSQTPVGIAYMAAAREAIPEGYRAVDETVHRHFLTADFVLARDARGKTVPVLVPRLAEIRAFPSVHGYPASLFTAYRAAFGKGHFSGTSVVTGQQRKETNASDLLKAAHIRTHSGG